MHAEANPKAVGGQAYVQFTTFNANDAINEGGVCTGKSLMERVRCVRHRGK